MAGEKKSKTDVSARAGAKGRKDMCKSCGKEIAVVLRCTPSGKRRMVRTCCES